MQNQVPDIFAFMVQDPQTPLNWWKWAFLLVIWGFYPNLALWLVIWPSFQILGQKCGQIFDNFQEIFHITTVSLANQALDVLAFMVKDPQTLLNGWKWAFLLVIWGFYPNSALWLKIKLEKWANLFSPSKSFLSKDSFYSKIRCLNFLDFKSRPSDPSK